MTSLVMSCSSHIKDDEIVYDESGIGKLDNGEYESMITSEELNQKSDFGIDSLEIPQGDMVGAKSEFFKPDYKEADKISNDNMTTPTSMKTFFDPDKTVMLTGEYNYSKLKKSLDEYLPSKDIIYGIEISGKFDYIQTRSISGNKQQGTAGNDTPREVSIAEFADIEGTIVGFWIPGYMKNVGVRGYHFHFKSRDKKMSGHLLDFKINNPVVYIDFNSQMHLSLIDD